jgi:hypothetical protein
MVTYHYVKFYVSIIIYLEVININVQNFNFPIGFYSNPHPLWTPQNMTLTPLTTKVKTLIIIIIIIILLFLSFFLSVDHELVHGRSQELLDRISWNLVEL